MEGASNRAWMKPFLTRLKPIFREVLTMSLFVNLIALVTPVFTLQVYDRVVGSGGIATLWGLLVGMIFVVLFDVILKQTRSKIMQTVALRIDVLVGRQLFDKLMSLPLDHLEGKPANYWQSLFRDVDVVRNTLSGGTALLACDLPFVFMFFALIIVIAKPLAIVLLIILPVFLFVAWRSANVMSAANQAERQSSQGRDALIAEMIQGRTTIKSLALDRSMRPYWEEAHADNIEQAMHRGSKTDLYSNLGQSLTMITTILMTSVGAYMIINQELTMGALIATNMLSGRLLGPLNQLVGQWRAYNSFLQSVDRLGEIFGSPSERAESEVKMDRPEGDLKAEAVTFAYNESTAPVVDTVSIHIKPCGIHALVGRNGSGKTTLLKILQGLYTPTSGRVLLDGADIAQFTRAELANWMGYVPQECVLFQGTVRDNIVHRHPGATDDEIVAASTAAGVHHFIIDLPDGYATDIGEAGSRLSGGQRQRIAIARALLGDPAVLLLDEPSASLDRQAEQELKNTLVDIAQHHTVVMVTHSPILLAACDELVALDKGKVALAGPSKEILPRLFGQAPGPRSSAAPGMTPNSGDAAKPRLPSVPPASAPVGAPPASAPAGAPPPRPQAPPASAAAAPTTAKPPPPLPGQVPPAAPAPAPAAQAAPPPTAPARMPPPRPPAVGAGPRPAAPASGASATADPSVPAGDMFRLGAGKSALLDDPYADLIDAARDKDRKSKTEDDEAMVEGKT